MSAEELKAAMRQYADEHFAGWQVLTFVAHDAGVMLGCVTTSSALPESDSPQIRQQQREPSRVSS